MRSRIVFALFLSAVLITGAAWARAPGQKTSPALVALGTSDTAYADAYWPEGEPTNDTPESLTTTDLIGRQLILDYVSLAAEGEATESSILSLANQYAENISALNNRPGLSLLDIKTVPDSKAAFENYDRAVNKIHDEYAEELAEIYSAEPDFGSQGAEIYESAKALGTAYENASRKLREVSAPLSLAALHLRLLNNYVSSGKALSSVSKTDEDPVVAFAGVIALNKGLSEIDTILAGINGILAKYGI